MRANTSAAAPTMNSDSPRSAWLASRPTGASANAKPDAAAAAASRSVTSGSIVLMSTIVVPRRACSITPPRPPITSFTAAESGSIVNTTSTGGRHASHVRRGLRAQRLERAHRSRTDVVARTRRTPLRTRFDAMGLPHVSETDETDNGTVGALHRPSLPSLPSASAQVLDAHVLDLRVARERLESFSPARSRSSCSHRTAIPRRRRRRRC